MGTTQQGDTIWITIIHSNDKIVLIDLQRQTITRPGRVCSGPVSHFSYFKTKLVLL